jgi:sulfur carrier protein ThiS
MTGASALSAETKRDAEGNVISSKVTASNEVGGSIGTEDIKLAASVAEGFAAEVTGGKAKAELSQTTKGSDLGKTLDNIVAAASDPLGAVLNPGKLVGATADVKAIDLNDEEMTALASRALDKTKWDSQVGGGRRDEWVVAGDKIRAAITEKDGVVVGVNKTVVNRAIAEWTKGSDGDRVGVLRQMMRPEGGKGAPSGKDVAFPDGTEKYKPVWDGLMTVDVLAGPKALMATDPKGALDQLQEVNGKLNDLRFARKDMEGNGAGAEGQFAEMMGHIVGRVHDCDQAILEAKKAMKGAGKKGKSKPASAGVEKVMQAFAEDEAQAERDPVDLQAYRENLEQMQVYFDAVFGLIKEAQAKSQEKGIFSGAGIEEAKAAGELLRSARERLGQWKPLYDKTYKLWEALSPRHELDKAAMEKLHPHGAQEFYDQVHKDVTK